MLAWLVFVLGKNSINRTRGGAFLDSVRVQIITYYINDYIYILTICSCNSK